MVFRISFMILFSSGQTEAYLQPNTEFLKVKNVFQKIKKLPQYEAKDVRN